MSLKCPHCHHPAMVRTSRELSPLLRELYCQCSNVICGHTFKAMTEIIKTLSPAALPDPGIAAQLEAKQPTESARQPPSEATRLHFAQLEKAARTSLARQRLGTPPPRGETGR